MNITKGNTMRNLKAILLLALAGIAAAPAASEAREIMVTLAEGDSLWFQKENLGAWETRAVGENLMDGARLAKYRAQDLASFSQEDLDRFYALLPSGPIPHGKFNGIVIFGRGGPLDGLNSLMGEKAAGWVTGGLKKFAETIWKGKVFNRETMVLQNRITFRPEFFEADATFREETGAFHLLKAAAFEYFEEKFGERLWFPAKLYCGQSRFDSRRESVIIDYAYNETITANGMYGSGPAFGGDILPEVRKPIDALVGRTGMNIRDEIRMVRPGLYLGRAYLANAFVLNFALELADANEPGNLGGETKSDCWSSEQHGIVATAGGR